MLPAIVPDRLTVNNGRNDMVTRVVEDHRECPFRYCEWTEDMAYCALEAWFCTGDTVPQMCPLRSGPITVELSIREQHGSSR
jgi:hypothetical protein